VQPLVMIIDDDESVRSALTKRLEQDGCRVHASAAASEGLQQLGKLSPDLLLLDYRLPDGDDLELLKKVRRRHPDLPVVMMTAFPSIETAIRAMHAGIYDYISKPFGLDQMMLVVHKALEAKRLRSQVQKAATGPSEQFGFDRLAGRSPRISEIVHLLKQLTKSKARIILLQGESGTGKDLAAKIIHYNSPRAARPFMNITCTALPETLLESELFGHEKGAFTDARHLKQGLFELADGGTIFLDEIGDMPASLQAKLLRFIEEKTFRRVGGTTDIHVDVCIIAATNRLLRALVEQGQFREDLFYRLNVFPVTLPPLRERAEDIPWLAEYFIDQYNREFHKNVAGLDPAALAVIQAYRWPGNVRQLRNIIERAMLMSQGGFLTTADLAPELQTPDQTAQTSPEPGVSIHLGPEGIDIRQVERLLVEKALEQTHGNQSRAAALLKISRDQLRYRIQKYHLKTQREEPQGPQLNDTEPIDPSRPWIAP